MAKPVIIPRDISWLSFNARVLQEALDETVPLKERIKFLSIFSNNQDEFFRVRVATLRNMVALGNKARVHLENNPEAILEQIKKILTLQQDSFNHCWQTILRDLNRQNIFLLTETELSASQQQFVLNYYHEEVRSYIVPLMIESLQTFPVLNDKSIYLACKLSKKDYSVPQRFALVSVPVRHLGRFVILPSEKGKTNLMLLEDVVRFCLPIIFSFFGYDEFTAHVIKMTRDAEFDADDDVSTNLTQKLEKGLRSRKKGKPVRFVFDKNIDITLLTYLTKRLGLTKLENIVPGGRIHNFRDFINFPEVLKDDQAKSNSIYTHPLLAGNASVSEVVLKRDVLLNFPYHSFDSVIDLLREAAIDPQVESIKITCYRLAARSKVINALTNAVRNGKAVTVMLELRARFDEEANLEWKSELEEAGVNVLLGVPNMKVHAKLCIIRRRVNNFIQQYGFVSTGNLNENTAKVYGDHCLLTSDKKIMADVERIFSYLQNSRPGLSQISNCKTLLVCPTNMRQVFINMIDNEIKAARKNKKSGITLKLNALTDLTLISKLTEAAVAGVRIKMVIRSICSMFTENDKFPTPIKAISIVDEYLEHARVMIFENEGKKRMFISSADWMVRNLDHRIEAACPVKDRSIIKEITRIIDIQLRDNVKARILDNAQQNNYVPRHGSALIRSQEETLNYVRNKTYGRDPDNFVKRT